MAPKCSPEAHYAENRVKIRHKLLFLKMGARRGVPRTPRRSSFREKEVSCKSMWTRPGDTTPAGQHSLPGAKNSKSSVALQDRGVEGVVTSSSFRAYMMKIE